MGFRFIIAFFSLVLFLGATPKTFKRPNILVILFDDMGFSDLGCYGSEISTPTIDQLAAGGIRYTQFYNAARCCPSRASLLTGVYPHQAGIGGMTKRMSASNQTENPYQGYLSRHTLTIAEVLKATGYQTYMAGKWHVGEDSANWPLKRGFDQFYGPIGGAGSYFESMPNRVFVRNMTPIKPEKEIDSFYLTDQLGNVSVEYLKKANQNPNQPFFLYLALTAPHWPLHAKESDRLPYDGTYSKGWENYRNNRFSKQKELGIISKHTKLSPADSVFGTWENEKNKENRDRQMATYAAMISSADAAIHKIVQTLKEQNQYENTLIMILSDNGACHEVIQSRTKSELVYPEAIAKAQVTPVGDRGSYEAYGKPWANVSNTPFRYYKHWTHEGGIASPFIVSYPAVLQNKGSINTQHIGHIMDLMPTILEASGATYPSTYNGNTIKPLEGKSLFPTLKGKKAKQHRYLCWEHEHNRGVRMGNWKLVSVDGKAWELYQVQNDRTELKDLSKENPRIVQKMEAIYTQWAKRVGV